MIDIPNCKPIYTICRRRLWPIGIWLSILSIFACQNPDSRVAATKGSNSADTPVKVQTYINLGGDEQYVEMNGSSGLNPVLLFIHGGPGWPQTPQLRYFNSGLNEKLTVVAWDQAGCGKSYQKDPNPKNLSLEKFVLDAHELTQKLKTRFGKRRIYIAGFSWGSIIALELVNRYPDDYLAYFAISQVINVEENFQVSGNWIRKQAVAANDTGTLRQLYQISLKDSSLCNSRLDCFLKQFELLNRYHGAIYRPEMEKEIEKSQEAYPDYRNYDWLGGFLYSAKRLENDLFTTNLSAIRKINIPVYFFLGRHDWNVPAVLTEKYVDALQAPKKEIVWFENSGHEPLEEESGLFNKAILNRINQ